MLSLWVSRAPCKSIQIHQSYLSLLPQGRTLTKKCVKRKNGREKNVCQVDKMDRFNEEEYETDQSVYMCHVNTNEFIGSQGVSNYSINVNVEGVAIPMDIALEKRA